MPLTASLIWSCAAASLARCFFASRLAFLSISEQLFIRSFFFWISRFLLPTVVLTPLRSRAVILCPRCSSGIFSIPCASLLRGSMRSVLPALSRALLASSAHFSRSSFISSAALFKPFSWRLRSDHSRAVLSPKIGIPSSLMLTLRVVMSIWAW